MWLQLNQQWWIEQFFHFDLLKIVLGWVARQAQKNKENGIKTEIYFCGTITDDSSTEMRTECCCKRYTVSIFRSIRVNDALKYENQRNRIYIEMSGNVEYFHCSQYLLSSFSLSYALPAHNSLDSLSFSIISHCSSHFIYVFLF